MILIRADGNARTGAGHLMRCSAVGEALASLGEPVCFVCADEESAALARERGFRARVLGSDYGDLESELPLWGKLTEEETAWAGGAGQPLILADSYYVTDRYLTSLRGFGKVALLEDTGTRPYPADCVINYNAPADPERYRKLYEGQDVRLLIGSRYVPLREQFRKVLDRRGALSEQQEKETEGAAGEKAGSPVGNVLITAGGGDSGNIGGRILEKIYEPSLQFRLVTGPFNPHLGKLKEWERRYDNIRIYHDVKNMAELMGECQMALTAGGSTIYELAALGVPFICFSCADNQEALTEYVGGKDIGGYAGAWHRDEAGTLERVGKLFEELAGDPGRRLMYADREREMTDGQGALRLTEELLRLTETSA